MTARFAFVELSIPVKPAHMGIIVTDLLYPPFLSWQVVKAAVADMPEIHPTSSEPADGQGRSHAVAFRVAPPN